MARNYDHLPMVGVCSGGTSEAELRDAGAAEVFSDFQGLLERMDGSAQGLRLGRPQDP